MVELIWRLQAMVLLEQLISTKIVLGLVWKVSEVGSDG